MYDDYLNSGVSGDKTMAELTLAQVNTILMAAVQAARHANYKPMAIVVLDASGNLKAAQRA